MRKLAAVAIAGSLQEAGDRRFAFMRLPPGQWRSARTTPSGGGSRIYSHHNRAVIRGAPPCQRLSVAH